MAADVVFTGESPWCTNSHTWNRITEYAASHAGGPAQEDYQSHLDVLGVDFTFLTGDTAAGVAGWLCGVIESMLAEGEIGPSEADRAHAHELIRKLRSETQVRAPGHQDGAEREAVRVAGEIALAAEVTPYAAAALSAYGAAVLAKAKDDLADATVGAGRRVLQRIFGRRQDDGELPAVLAEVVENPGDKDYLAALRLAIRKALESDAGLSAEVREIVVAAGTSATVSQRVSAGRDAYVAGRDMTISRDAE